MGGGFRFLFCYFSFSNTHTHTYLRTPCGQADKTSVSVCVWLILLQWETDPAGRNPLMAAHAPHSVASKPAVHLCPSNLQSAIKPESLSTPVINTEPRFLFHSFILPMTQTFNGERQKSASEILGSALDFCIFFLSFLRYPLGSNADSRGRGTAAVFFGEARKCIVRKALACLTQSVMLGDSSACTIFLLNDLLGSTVRHY